MLIYLQYICLHIYSCYSISHTFATIYTRSLFIHLGRAVYFNTFNNTAYTDNITGCKPDVPFAFWALELMLRILQSAIKNVSFTSVCLWKKHTSRPTLPKPFRVSQHVYKCASINSSTDSNADVPSHFWKLELMLRIWLPVINMFRLRLYVLEKNYLNTT